MPEIPYPPVFHDWRPDMDGRVATGHSTMAPEVQMRLPSGPPNVWHHVELTEDDACLLAASLLQRAERDDLAQLVLDGLAPKRSRWRFWRRRG